MRMIRFSILLAALVVASDQFLFEDSLEPSGELSFTKFRYHQKLNEDYDLYWNFNISHIVFKTVVKTNGFVGFGISPNGGMVNSDVVIGWVKDGKAHFANRYAEGHYMPAINPREDWTLIEANEEGEFTTLVFLREQVTCNLQHVPIYSGTTRVIYSYGPEDPVSDTLVNYHGYTRRGTKSILLLTPPPSVEEARTLPSDVITIDFLNNYFPVPKENTHYGCIMLKLPALGQKHHLIRYEPVIQQGNEDLVHHIMLLSCVEGFETNFVDVPFSCYGEARPEVANCKEQAFMAWTIGGQTFNFPDNVGQSLGSPDDPVYFRMEIHYSNPSLRADVVDNSGLRLYLTKQIREFDVGLLMTGVMVDKYHVIPPFEEKFQSPGYCTPSCIEQNLGDEEVKIFASLPHTHLLGRTIKTRHIRNNVELAPIFEENHYDFNYQEWRLLKEERLLKKGDFLLVECEYDSRQRTSVTYGGLNTTMEMCQSFHMYYPKSKLGVCLTRLKYKFDDTANVDDFVRVIEQKNWSDPDVRQQFKKDVEESQILEACGNFRGKLSTTPFSKPAISQVYQQPDKCVG